MKIEPAKFTGTGGQILMRCLSDHGVRRLSCVAGESYLAVMDAWLEHPEIQVVTCRQEGGAAFMAESWGKLDAHVPGVCFVTRGPGACNASIGVHTAMQDSTPLLLFMGQVGRGDRGREAFQEIDVRQVFGGLAKWATEIDDAARIPEVIYRAVTTAISGRPGPVVIGLPEDMLRDSVTVRLTPPVSAVSPRASARDSEAVAAALRQAKQPLAIVGGTGWSDADCARFQQFAERVNLPVAASFRRQDLFDHRSPSYVGELGTGPNPALLAKAKEADLLLVLGARLDEICMQGYTLFDAPVTGQTLVHVHPAASEIGKVYVPDVAMQSVMTDVISVLSVSQLGTDWSDWLTELHAQYEQWTDIDLAAQPPWKGANMTAIFAFLRDALPADAIVTTDAGNFSGWAQRYLRYGRPGRLLAPISGAMGYAVPAAVGAALAQPGRTVLGLCGDGGFMMTGQELATAMHHNAAPVIMICNNNMYGTIQMHQQRDYPGRISGTTLTNPDFTALARSYGAFAAKVTDANDFPAVWAQATAAGTLAVIEVEMDPRQLTTRAEL